MINPTLKTYNRVATDFSRRHFKPFWVKEFEYFKKIVPGKKVVDIGCGAGRDAVVFVKNKFDYLGIDGSSGMLKVASERVKNGKFKLMDYYKLDLPQKSFDGFWAAASLLHIPKNKIVQVLESLKSIIKENGVGFISIKEKVDADHKIIKYGNHGLGRYFSFYTKDEFNKLLEKAGFRIDKIIEHLELENDGSTTNWLCYFVRK